MLQISKNFLKDAVWFLNNLYEKKNLVAELVKRELKVKYTGSYLGPVWIFLEPIFFIGIIWLVFTIGLRGRGSVENVPFIVFLSAGVISWGFFAENFNANTELVKQYSFLLTKTDVAFSVIPIVKIASSLLVHCVLVVLVVAIAAANKVYPTIYTVQIFYYTASAATLLVGLGWLTSALNVFVPDVAKVVKVLTQFGFWITPIVWSHETVEAKSMTILKLNPVFYIVQGYRDSIYTGVCFWEKPFWSLYFWTFTMLFLFLGAVMFKRLRPHFAAVA